MSTSMPELGEHVLLAIDTAIGTTVALGVDERVHVATEPYGTRQRELLSLGGASAPALGMVDRRLDRGNSVAW